MHLLPWFGLKSDHRIIALLRQESGHELLQDCYATLIAVGRQRRNSAAPGRRRGATCGGQIAPDKPGASPPILPSWRSCYQVTKHRDIDSVLGKTLRVLGHAELLEPVRTAAFAAILRRTCDVRRKDIRRTL